MDIMAKVNELVEAITKDDKLMAQFKKDPVQAVRGLVKDLDLDDEVLDKLVKGIQGKIGADKVRVILLEAVLNRAEIEISKRFCLLKESL